MDSLNTSLNYQRAVTPTIDTAGSVSSAIRGKPVSYTQQPIRGRSSSSRPVGLSNLNTSIDNIVNPSNSVKSSGRLSATSQLSATFQHSPTRVLHRGAALATSSANHSGSGSDLNLQGKSVANSSSLLSKAEESSTDLKDPTSLSRYDVVPLTEEIPADGILFARIRNKPDSLVVFRTNEERARNPERLNLDRRQLEVCPILEQEHRLRLLNYQNNNIKSIQNLENLQNLIFLDMYNNKLTSLDGPLSTIRGLRVLMAGKNKINVISNLSTLRKMDVLDLHSNEIRVIEGLDGLAELRVLNLAGNRITIVQNLSSLQALTELNLRRNLIEKIVDLDRLPSLQRVFLSHNHISSLKDVSCLFDIKMLIELSMDGNPVSEHQQESFRRQMITSILSLRYYDLKRISDEERQAAFDTGKSSDSIEESSKSSDLRQPLSLEPVDGRASSTDNRRQHGGVLHTEEDLSPVNRNKVDIADGLVSQVRLGKYPNSTCHFELESLGVSGEKSLTIIGESWDWPQNKRIFSQVTEVSFVRVKKETISAKAVVGYSSLSLVKTLRLIKNDISSLVDLESLADLFLPSIEDVEIRENAVALTSSASHSKLLKYFLIAKLPLLKAFNGQTVDVDDRLVATQMLQPLLRMRVLNCMRADIKLQKSSLSRNVKETSVKRWIIPANLQAGINSGMSEDSIAGDILHEITSRALRRRRMQKSFEDLFDAATKQIIEQALANLLN